MYSNKMVWNTVEYTYDYFGELGIHLHQGNSQTHFRLRADNQTLCYGRGM